MFEQAKHTRKDRKEIYSFDGPPSTDPYDQDESTTWNQRIKIEFSHSKSHKRYEATVWKCVATTRDGYTMERFAVFSGDNAIIYSEPAARYSDRTFMVFCVRSIDLILDIIPAETNTSRGAELLRMARDFADLGALAPSGS